jgi:NADH-quinone oxidoreductase subunit M
MTNILTLDFLLLLVVLMPLLGIVCIAFLDVPKNSTNIKQIVIWTTTFALVFTTWLLLLINNNDFFLTAGDFSQSSSDHIAIYMIELTALVFFMGAMVFRTEEVLCLKRYSLAILALEALLFLFFTVTSIIVFYFLLEMISLMMFVAIICASPHLSRYALRLLISSFCGSSFILFGVVYIINVLGIREISILSGYVFSIKQDFVIFAAFFIGFLLKSVLMTMISKVNQIISEAPISLSIILAGIFMQTSNFGFITILQPISKIYFTYFQHSIVIVALLTMALHVLMAATQMETKRIVANLFVVQMCVAIIGIFSGNTDGMSGGLFGMIFVSVITSALLMSCHLANNFMDATLQYQTNTLHFQHIKIVFTIPMLAIASIPFTPLFGEEILITYGLCQSNSYVLGLALCCITAGTLFGALKMKKIIFTQLASAKLSMEYLYELGTLCATSALLMIVGILPNDGIRKVMAAISTLTE